MLGNRLTISYRILISFFNIWWNLELRFKFRSYVTLYYYSAEAIYDGLLKLKFTEKKILSCLSCGSCPLCPVRMVYSDIFAIPITNNYLSSVGCFIVVDRSSVHLQFFWKRKEKHNRNLRWRNQDGGSKMAVIYFFVRQLTTFCF